MTPTSDIWGSTLGLHEHRPNITEINKILIQLRVILIKNLLFQLKHIHKQIDQFFRHIYIIIYHQVHKQTGAFISQKLRNLESSAQSACKMKELENSYTQDLYLFL